MPNADTFRIVSKLDFLIDEVKDGIGLPEEDEIRSRIVVAASRDDTDTLEVIWAELDELLYR